ncbi:hypothetical protein GCM10007939_18700 [Amylibacter marinus]|uniref:Uncharacterized protein n=1 Tax=Amylibacter marinus TaxID=1475483 RepID=A0ABQ5VWB8_9RHOB|nr:hypothetical protein GCM10007939_18700 [Amylibacter marinus]
MFILSLLSVLDFEYVSNLVHLDRGNNDFDPAIPVLTGEQQKPRLYVITN